MVTVTFRQDTEIVLTGTCRAVDDTLGYAYEKRVNLLVSAERDLFVTEARAFFASKVPDNRIAPLLTSMATSINT